MTIISKKDFIEHVKAGWKKLDFTEYDYWKNSKGKKYQTVRISYLPKVHSACAIGAAAWSLGMTPKKYLKKFIKNNHLFNEITGANDRSFDKKEALREIRSIKWPKDSNQ